MIFEWPTDPDLLFDSAREVRCYQVGQNGETRYFLIFSRTCTVIDEDQEPTCGASLALFECDSDGKVFDFNQRFESEGSCFKAAFFHFAYRLVNDLIKPVKVQIIPDHERDRLDAMMSSNDHIPPHFDDSCP